MARRTTMLLPALREECQAEGPMPVLYEGLYDRLLAPSSRADVKPIYPLFEREVIDGLRRKN